MLVRNKTMNITPLLHQYCEYAQHIQGYSKVTTFNYKATIDTFIRRTGITQTSELTRENLESYFIDGRANRNWTTGSFTTYYMIFRSFFNWCCERKYLEVNPVVGIKYPKVVRGLPKRLTRQEAEKLLETTRNHPYFVKFLKVRNHAIIATFIFTGLRKSELLSLDCKDVDLENKTIHIRHGKGGKSRYVPISPRLYDILVEYNRGRTEFGKTCEPFFVSARENRGFTAHGLKYMLEHLKKLSGLSFGAHTLRHTFATLMLEGGCNIYALSKMMGHSKIDTTIIYLHASAQHVQAEAIKHPMNIAMDVTSKPILST